MLFTRFMAWAMWDGMAGWRDDTPRRAKAAGLADGVW